MLAILNSTAALFTMIIAYLWINEPVSKKQLLGLVIGFIGILIIVNPFNTQTTLIASLACLLALDCSLTVSPAPSSGFSAASASTDLLASESAEYITSIRDAGSTVTGAVFVDIAGTQAVETTFNDSKETYLSGVTDVSATANVLKDASFGGIGHVLGFSNTDVVSPRFDANNQKRLDQLMIEFLIKVYCVSNIYFTIIKCS